MPLSNDNITWLSLVLLVSVPLACCSDSATPRVEIHDYPIPANASLFRFESASHPRLVRLRELEGLDRVVQDARSELERFVLLRDWTKRQWTHSKPRPYPPWDALIILDWIRTGKTGGFCAQYAVVFLQACLSMGYQGRYLDINKEGGTGHFVTEVWSNQFAKWVVMDPDYNVHYEKAGIPLSAVELHNAWVQGRWKEVMVVEGPNGAKVPDIHTTQFNMIDYYHHFSVDLRNDHLSHPFPFWNRKDGYLSWRDPHTDGRPRAHQRFALDPMDLYWPLNSVDMEIGREEDPYTLRVQFKGLTPDFETYLVRLDSNGKWFPTESGFAWKLHEGRNRIEVRVRNRMGITGPISHAEVWR